MQIVYGHLKALRLDSLSNYLAGGLPCLLLCKFGNGRELCLAEAIAARLMGWGEEGNDDNDNDKLFPLRDALCFLALMEALGVGEVAEKMEAAYNHLQKAAWGSLLELLNSDPLHALLLLLKSGDGKGSCLADTMVKKVAHNKRVTCEQADGFLKLLQKTGYLPSNFEKFVKEMKEQATKDRSVG